MLRSTTLTLSLASVALCATALAGDPTTDVFPTPQKVGVQEAELSADQLDPASVMQLPALVDAFKARNARPSGKLPVKTHTGDTGKAMLRNAQVSAVPGAYILKVDADGIEIAAADDTGIFYATQTLAQMIAVDGKLSYCRIADWPDIAFRGSIEGFYGKPWEHARRLSQIEFYGKYKMNAYIYGPKDDPYSGFNSQKWRDEYPADQAKQITELVEAAKKNHVNFIWALHPGSSIRWDDKDGDGTPDDIIIAQKKLEAMYALGVRSFAVFFDDIGGEGARAEMQAKMLNQINRDFIKKKPDVTPLVMCPTSYSGSGANDYKKNLGEQLDKDIDIMWTGPGICSDIPAKAVEEVSVHWQRKPFIWWNWPVNDYCRTNLLMGRTYGLDKGNKGLLSGFASNPMDKPEASKLGLFSIADWAWNIEAFDSEKSWRAAFPRLFPSVAKEMFVFAKHNSDQGPSFHNYHREESVEIKPTVDQALANYRDNKQLTQADVDALLNEFAEITAASDKMIATLPQTDPALWHEIEYWVKCFKSLGEAGTAAVKLASGNAGDGNAHMALFSVIANAKAQQQDFSAAQKQRHFEETFASDKQWAKGSLVATLVLTPLVDELFTGEWAKASEKMGSKVAAGNAAYKAFSNADTLKNLRAERDGKFINLVRILEVVKLKPNQHIGLALPDGVFGNYIHIKLDNEAAANACKVEVASEWDEWKPFNARKGGGDLQNPLNANDKIRFFRLVNTSNEPVEFRIEKFKFDVPGGAKANSAAATTDNDPTSFYLVENQETITGPDAAKASIVLSDAPASAIKKSGNKVTITPPAGGKVRVFEIIWR